jgi:hypothetical protein
MLFGFATAPPLGSTLVVTGPLLTTLRQRGRRQSVPAGAERENMTFPQFANWVT